MPNEVVRWKDTTNHIISEAFREGEVLYERYLMVLIEILNRSGENTSGLASLVELNPFAVQYRYRSLDTEEEELDRSTLLGEIQALFDRVETLIS